MVALVVNHIESIQAESGDRLTSITFSIGVDATAVVKAWLVFHVANVVVGGASLNHKLAIGSENTDDIKACYESCYKGQKGDLTGGEKIALISF